ncbi:unnamed protein product [Bursaphelenchus xylophilus]|uniref:(pine wood nematode) hypothetical protein n=1 Tax=Bursaphelenchus xylophilus TaxID=6326 RepID=A0A1I7RLP6_BURXY|nr:unnamed protein product [Bursaphelenchus xylophilus]CAG9082732.1 unnamed protein product [Bursaphelenchus xylophilus]
MGTRGSMFSASMPTRSSLKVTNTLQERVRRCTTIDGILNVLNVRHQGGEESTEALKMLTPREFFHLTVMDLRELEFSDQDIDKIMKATTDTSQKPKLAVYPQRRLSFADSLTVHQISPNASSNSFSSSSFSNSTASFESSRPSMMAGTPIRRNSKEDKLPENSTPKATIQNLIKFFNNPDSKPCYPTNPPIKARPKFRSESFSHTHYGGAGWKDDDDSS